MHHPQTIPARRANARKFTIRQRQRLFEKHHSTKDALVRLLFEFYRANGHAVPIIQCPPGIAMAGWRPSWIRDPLSLGPTKPVVVHHAYIQGTATLASRAAKRRRRRIRHVRLKPKIARVRL